jgi:outer membrane protein assembly factor BamB
MLDADTGGEVGAVDLGEPLKSCVVQVDAWKPTSAPAKVGPLADQLSDALLNREAQLATAKRLLLRELAALTDETATKTLVALASDPRTSPLLLPDARTALANRRNGAPYMIQALARHYDYLKDVLRPPPVGPMAQALAAMKRTDAAPLLAEHLLDPADTDDDVRRAAEALVGLASPSEATTIKQFVGMYRANASDDQIEAAVVAAAQALVRVGGADGRASVQAAVADPFTLAPIHDRLQVIMDNMPPPAPATDTPAPKKKR